jgi:glycerol uptake facilitator-like aquaporin
MTERLPLLRRLLAEALGTLILVATIVGSGATAGALVCMFLFPAPKVHSVRAMAPGE